MLRKYSDQTASQFNMTPIIDIVFLLIIFFLLVCQFIVAENFEVAVPDNIASSRPAASDTDQTTTVTVMFTEEGLPAYAVGSSIIATDAGQSEGVDTAIAAEIDTQLANLPPERRVVNLRIDKDITYKHSRLALAGISRSSATDIKLAVTKAPLN